MKKFFLLLFILPFFVFCGVASAEQGYTLLEPGVYNDQFTTIDSKTSFSDYLNLVFKVGIGIAAGLAVIQIVIGGIQYMASESPFKIGDAKSKIEGAILGLILALGIYIFLYTINPDLVSLNLNVIKTAPSMTVGAGVDTPTSTKVPSSIQECLNCKFIPPTLNVKNGACTALGLPTKTCRANQGIIDSLIMLKNQPTLSDITWQITEAYPPTYPHKSACHNNGGCVDLNFLAGWFSGVNKSAETINTFCLEAKKVGLKPFYEVKNTTERDSLIKNGVTCVRAVPEINAAHFHVEQ